MGGSVVDLLQLGNVYYAVGQFSRTNSGKCLKNVASFSPGGTATEWADVAGGCDGTVQSIVAWNNKIYVTGFFQFCGKIEVNGVAGYNPATSSWFDLNGGFTRNSFPSVTAGFSLTVFNNAVVAAGVFSSAGGTTCNGICSWDGTKWERLGSSECTGCGEFGPTSQRGDPTYWGFSVQARDPFLYAIASSYNGSAFPIETPVVTRYSSQTGTWQILSSLPNTLDLGDSMDYEPSTMLPIGFNGTEVWFGVVQDPSLYFYTESSLKKRGIGASLFQYFVPDDITCLGDLIQNNDKGEVFTAGSPYFDPHNPLLLFGTPVPYFDLSYLRTYNEGNSNFKFSNINFDGAVSAIAPISG